MTEHNDGQHIQKILAATDCGKHAVPVGIPCFHIRPGNAKAEFYLPAVCGKRIRRAGYTGTISPDSLSRGSKSRGTRKN